jgi:hypothetical protein
LSGQRILDQLWRDGCTITLLSAKQTLGRNAMRPKADSAPPELQTTSSDLSG